MNEIFLFNFSITRVTIKLMEVKDFGYIFLVDYDDYDDDDDDVTEEDDEHSLQ